MVTSVNKILFLNEVKIVPFLKDTADYLLKNNPNRPFWLADPLLCSQNPDRSTFH
jgi:hypothetical protein